ncbi:uncharacterized protein LOC121855110 [Homarus americanus]|uniref:uncharacterized protein LOC121855110 n=1 Tax=Homarus americanus TaxID=6706 RepID=UPI001C4833A5|nr:uncharacterized protein LOC121855110 [Homarus americanus]
MQQLLLLQLLAASTVLGATLEHSQRIARNVNVEWPKAGLEVCEELQDERYSLSCQQCFHNSGKDFKKIKVCVRDWLPQIIARCATNAHAKYIKSFNSCIAHAIKYNAHLNQRANLLCTKGGALLKRVSHSKILPNGPAAIYSSMAQELLITTEPVKSLLEEPDHDCFDRFKVDENNKNWHLHSSGSSGEGKQRTSRDFDHTANSHHPKASPAQAAAERDMVYEYGNTGHDMPFEGVGPLAVDVLMGECIVAYLEGKGKLQILVDEILESPAPVPAWIFQELLTLIKTIKLT